MMAAPVRTRPFRRKRFVPTASALTAARTAMEALNAASEPMTSDDVLALREQLRVEDELRGRRQGELRLVSKGRA